VPAVAEVGVQTTLYLKAAEGEGAVATVTLL